MSRVEIACSVSHLESRVGASAGKDGTFVLGLHSGVIIVLEHRAGDDKISSEAADFLGLGVLEALCKEVCGRLTWMGCETKEFQDSAGGEISSSTFGFVSLGVNKKDPSIVTGEGGGDNWGELAASMTLISLPMRPAASATIADNSASSSSSSSSEDDEEDDDDDEEDDDEEDDKDEAVEFEDERAVGSSKSLTTILLSFLVLLTSVSAFILGGEEGLGKSSLSTVSSLLTSSGSDSDSESELVLALDDDGFLCRFCDVFLG